MGGALVQHPYDSDLLHHAAEGRCAVETHSGATQHR
jgi:hypothetical protein